MPIFTFVDTPGAYPGIGAEERGQSEAIGHNLYVMSRLKTPIVATVIGEGGSGGVSHRSCRRRTDASVLYLLRDFT